MSDITQGNFIDDSINKKPLKKFRQSFRIPNSKIFESDNIGEDDLIFQSTFSIPSFKSIPLDILQYDPTNGAHKEKYGSYYESKSESLYNLCISNPIFNKWVSNKL